MLSTNIYLNKEIRIAYNKLKMDGLLCNGIIFGGMVRDEIIATYNKTLFDNFIKSNKELYKNYWDTSYHPESMERTRIPNDMDIYFSSKINADKFINKIEEFVKFHGGIFTIISTANNPALLYTIGRNCIHNKILITFRPGRTFSFAGHKIELKIDIIINTDSHYYYEPPFEACDFTCNLFVMVKNSQGYDIRLSNNTGTPLDSMDFISKKRIETKIIDELLMKRIEFIRNVPSDSAEYINGFRIMKMLKKDYKITNLLFRDIDKSKKRKDSKETKKCEYQCDICMNDIDINNNDNLIEILTNKYHKNIMHKSCFINYLDNEISKKYVNRETGEIECRCSRRNPFNFKKSFKYSKLFKNYPIVESIS